MLIIFAYSITPKITLHNIIARHKDTDSGRTDGKTIQFNQAGFRCDVDNLVVHAPFLSYNSFVSFDISPIHITRQQKVIRHFFPKVNIDFGLRGPPSSGILI
jgi:hypothetical protein